MDTVAAFGYFAPDISLLWHNVIGAVMVVTVGTLLSTTVRDGTATDVRDA